MAELKVDIGATSSAPLPTYTITNNVIKNVYIYSAGNVSGVATANNYVSIENTTGSGKTVLILGVFLSAVTTAASSALASMRANRAGTTSGGTTIGITNITKTDSNMATPTATVRTNNPTATLDGQIFAYPPLVSAGATSDQPYAVAFGAVPGGFMLHEGESMVINSLGDDTNRHWNFSILWGEI